MQRFITILIFVAAVPFAIYVWPTKYAYDQIKLGDSQFPVRIHRMTGECDAPQTHQLHANRNVRHPIKCRARTGHRTSAHLCWFDEVRTARIAGQPAPNTIALRLKIESLFAPPRILTVESSNTGRFRPPNLASSTKREYLQTRHLRWGDCERFAVFAREPE